MDLLQLLVVLTIMGICGAIAVLATGFSPRGVMILLFALIVGTLGAAFGGLLGGLFRAWSNAAVVGGLFALLTQLYDLVLVKIGTLRLSIIYTIIGSFAVIGSLRLLQFFLGLTERRAAKVKGSDGISS